MRPTSFWIKSRRAQNVDDFETWIQGGVTPTLNAFDNATETRATVLILAIDFYNANTDERNFHTLRSGGANEGKPGVLIIDGTRVNDVRVYEDGIMPTVISRYGTGGGNVPMIFDNSEPIAYDEFNDSISHIHHTLRAGTKQSTGVLTESLSNIVMPTLTAANNPSRSPQLTEVTAQVEVMQRVTSVVRRLTPKECERLQGFPDDWTDGQADSNRYKQCGNAVAVPVVEWIITRIISATN